MQQWKYEHREPTEQEFATAERYVNEGWKQVSRRWRTIARLPDGMNGNEALLWALEQYNNSDMGLGGEVPDFKKEWALSLSERSAASQFMRCYTSYDFAKHLQTSLTIFEFQAFRKLGGDSI